MQECDFPPFLFAQLSLDISRRQRKTHSNNQYIVTFIDMYSGWPEAFVVTNRKAHTAVYLLINEIFPPQLLTNNNEDIRGSKCASCDNVILSLPE